MKNNILDLMSQNDIPAVLIILKDLPEIKLIKLFNDQDFRNDFMAFAQHYNNSELNDYIKTLAI